MDWLILAAEEAKEPWAQVAGIGVIAGSCVSFILWFARHVVTVTVPSMMQTHTTVVEKLVTEFKSESKDARSHEQSRTDKLTAAIAESAQRNVEAINELRDTLLDHEARHKA